MHAPSVRTGLDILAAENFRRLRGLRVGVVAHPASVDARYRHILDLLAAAEGVSLMAIFGPEHGLLGEAQDLESCAADPAGFAGPRVCSLYGDSVDTLKPTPEQLADLDLLIVDLQDVGSRYYTFQATMLYCLEAAAAQGLRVMVLDRPNPLGGLVVEGPTILPGFTSFIGCHPIATRHGLTIGELAGLYRTELRIDVDLEIVPCEGWRREQFYDDTGLPWVLPSPNMPTLDTAIVYPGQCLLEGTNLSEGRGTTRPFELCGASDVAPRALAKRLENDQIPGVRFRPAWFRPTFQKYANERCGGVQMHVTDRDAFPATRAGLAVLSAFRQTSRAFAWRTEEYEFVRDPIAIDLLFGSSRERLGIEAGSPWRDLAQAWEPEEQEFRARREPFLRY